MAATAPDAYLRSRDNSSRHASASPGGPSTTRSSLTSLSLRLLRLGRLLGGFLELLHADRNDLDLQVRGHFAMQAHIDVVDSEGLDRMGELDAAFFDLHALRFECVGDLVRRHRPEELA